MLDGETITETPRPTQSAHDASDESGAESDTEAVRARLERAERELQALRCPLLGASELPVARYRLRDLLPGVVAALPHHDTGFLTDYLAVLRSRPPHEVDTVTCDVMSSIEDALRQQSSAEKDESSSLGDQRVVLCAFLCAACLSDTPRVRDARPVLRQLLADTTEEERVQLARMWWCALPAAALMLLSDAMRAPRAHAAHDAPSLAELLLRAALCRLPPHDHSNTEPQWELGAPRLEDLEGVLEEWARQRRHTAVQDAARVMLCGRVLAVAPPALRPALLRRLEPLLADKRTAAAAPAGRPDRKVGVCKLQILFGADEKIHIRKRRTPRKVPREEPLEETLDEPREEPLKEQRRMPRKEQREKPREEPRRTLRNEPRDEQREEPHKEPRRTLRNEPRQKPREEPRRTLCNEPREEPSKEPPEKPRRTLRNEPREKPREEPRRMLRNEPREEPRRTPRNEPCEEPRTATRR